MSDYDYTAGEPIPEAALNAEDIVLGDDAGVEHETAKTESENAFGDLAPGNHLLHVTGFGKAEKKLFDTYINAQRVSYEAFQVSVRLADEANTGSIFVNLRLPPDDKMGRMYYNHGTNAEGKPKSAGFMARIFGQFIDNLIPGAILEDGRLSPFAKALKNWNGKKVWAQVEDGDGGQIDKRTGLPYPPKPQVGMFMFRKFVEGQPCPLPAPRTKGSRPAAASNTPAIDRAFAGAGVNGTGRSAPVDDGLDDI